jgi:hypothetical protein
MVDTVLFSGMTLSLDSENQCNEVASIFCYMSTQPNHQDGVFGELLSSPIFCLQFRKVYNTFTSMHDLSAPFLV